MKEGAAAAPSARGAGPVKAASRFERLYKRGSLVFVEGDRGAEMFVVQTGAIRLLRQEGDDTVVAAVAGPGSVIGEMSFLNREPRTATAQVVEDAVVMAVDDELYNATLKSIPSWIGSSLKSLVRRLTETIRQTGEELVRRNMAGMIRVLLLLAENEGERESGELLVPLARLREQFYVLTGLSDGEIETIFLHLILKRMISIRKDAAGQEYLLVRKPDILRLYYNYLRASERGEIFPGDQLPLPVFDVTGFLLLCEGLTADPDRNKFIRVTLPQLEDEWKRRGNTRVFDAGSLNLLAERGFISKQPDGSIEFVKDKLMLLHLSGMWLPVFKEDVKL